MLKQRNCTSKSRVRINESSDSQSHFKHIRVALGVSSQIPGVDTTTPEPPSGHAPDVLPIKCRYFLDITNVLDCLVRTKPRCVQVTDMEV